MSQNQIGVLNGRIIWTVLKTDYQTKKSKEIKIERTKPGPNHGANERPRGEPAAVNIIKLNQSPKLFSEKWVFTEF